LVERNLLGRGQFLKLLFSLSSVTQNFDLSFTEPYFLDKNIAVGFDAFKVSQEGNNSNSNLAYDSNRIGGTLRASYPITEYLKHNIRYTYRDVDIDNIDPAASLFIQNQQGRYATSMVGHTLTYDKRDNSFEPTEGHYLQFTQDFAGIGGDAQFIRHEVKGATYHPLYKDDVVLKVAARGGHTTGWGDEDVRITDRFFVGGRLLRGFDSEGVGPRDVNTNDPLGGNIYGVGTAEVAFPIGLPEELGFKGSVFVEGGTLYDTDDKGTALNPIYDDNSFRASVGAGITWKSPIGPMRIDYAYPIEKQPYDEEERVRFSFGARF